MELTSLGGGVGHLKAGFFGWEKSGKTWTATHLAIGTREVQNLPGPIAMLDTEAAAQYVAPIVKAKTGKDLVGIQTRALGDAITFLRKAQEVGAACVVIDSVSHLWQEVCRSYLVQKNEQLLKAGKNLRVKLEFQDMEAIKKRWAEFADLFLTIRLNVICIGRAGNIWNFEENEETGKKELLKTGVKMKAEGDFGYEASLLVLMEREQIMESGRVVGINRRATVLGDRFGVIDGKSCENPTFEFFRPFVARLTPGAHATVDTAKQTQLGIDESGDEEWQREKRNRTIFSEEIQGLLFSIWPGMTAEEKKARQELLFETLGTRSWTQVSEKTGADALKRALEIIRAKLVKPAHPEAAPVASIPADSVKEEIGDHFAKTPEAAAGEKPAAKAKKTKEAVK